MIRNLPTLALAASLVLSIGCDKKPAAGAVAPVSPDAMPVAAAVPVADTVPEPAYHLGFATRIPKDADVFISIHHMDEMVRAQAELLPLEWTPEDEKFLDDISARAGDEAFLFVGPGLGAQLEMLGVTYRNLSAAWSEFATGAMLDALADQHREPDFKILTDALSNDLAEKWLGVLERDARLQVPGMVMGLKPAEEKQNVCLQAVGDSLDRIFSSEPMVKPVSFEASGVRLVGYEIPGRELFAEVMTGLRKKLADSAAGDDVLSQLSPERLERLLTAMEKLRLTVATGVTEGRVLLYLGDGPDGFRLASSPEESLAATAPLRWTTGFADKRLAGVAYLSKPMVAAALPWLDLSDTWRAVARAVRAPVRDERLFDGILSRLADTEHELAARDPSAWCAVVSEDEGWKYESRGGWPDPSLDYESPLRMTDAVTAARPAIFAQWVQNRGRNDLAWRHTELLATLVEAVVAETGASTHPMAAMATEGPLPRAMMELKRLNRAYRDEFRAGIGDEVALVVDFQGEIPTVPGISEETIRRGKAPRLLLARPVVDRALLTAAGKSFASSWRDLTAWASEVSGQNLPLIQPQSLESGGMVTWYPPLPFIGGDFVPGVTLNEKLWMFGTSRSMAADFSKALQAGSGNGGTGMRIEINAAPLRTWLESMYQLNREEVESLAEEAPDDIRKLREEHGKQLKSATDRIQGLSYRKWMETDQPRTSLHLRLHAN